MTRIREAIENIVEVADWVNDPPDPDP